ncbi:MAG: hypothetical protein JWO62_3116 [Acidimicrobiaceae bacterium]|nr:hypothetical protein [Acidimicrobiaceae bacterium]
MANALPERLRRDFEYLRAHRRIPKLKHPRTLTEKVNWRILNDRRRCISWTCDKLAMKAAAASCAHARVPRTHWYGVDLKELLDVDLPERWVLKPNNASGLVLPMSGPVSEEQVTRLIELTRGWLSPSTYNHLCEWAYEMARPMFLVEELVGDHLGPTDYKFFVFEGVPRFIQIDTRRFENHHSTYYDVEWTRLAVATKAFPAEADLMRPPGLEKMLRAASDLGRGFDFMRVDLYYTGNEVWFGEFTPYPGSGLIAFVPRTFDRQWGDLWQLPRLGEG